ncbi:U3 small nucleolar RNA-associated protein 6 [Favolaschia claudopus]|uniref:U3 small nucleolar RNA-associated protein 6 n=1 Tax=Favolaschia claudopus TaxID=2862362 RepID=A0AAW0DZN2_9AGAR
MHNISTLSEPHFFVCSQFYAWTEVDSGVTARSAFLLPRQSFGPSKPTMERVQFQQEQMLEELKDLVEKNIFTKQESKHIIKKRTQFETALVRRVAKKADFLRYAAYEMGLEQLRRKRVERLKIVSTQASLSDYALVRRQFQIFERALKKFKSDVALWIQYIELAKRERATTLVGRVVARAIQMHPDNASLYVLAAGHELDHGSPSAARTLLQRGLRLNPESIEMWREYVRMELVFMENLRRRWETLGLEDQKGKGRDEEEHADAENVHAEPSALAGDEARAAIMGGAIVKSVMNSAVQAVKRVELFEALIAVIHEMRLADGLASELLEQVYGQLREAHGKNGKAARMLAERFLAGELEGEALVDAVQAANEEMWTLCRDDMMEEYLEFAAATCKKVIDPALKEYLIAFAGSKGCNIKDILSAADTGYGEGTVTQSPSLDCMLRDLDELRLEADSSQPQAFYCNNPPMLQFSASPRLAHIQDDYSRPNDLSPRSQPLSLPGKRPQKEPLARAVFAPPPSAPLSISTNFVQSRTSSSAHLRSPYISARHAASPATYSPRPAFKSPTASRRSSFSSVLEDVLQPGDVVGEGVDLQGETIRLVSPVDPPSDSVAGVPAREFEVVRRLGAGSYAVVYQVLEVLERAPRSEDGHSSMMGHMDIDGKPQHARSPSTKYGREYAIKCLSKANLDDEALTAQMDEVTIHQSLNAHPNIVTLHRTLETSSFLLLLLEYVPGEDLFYFLEQARDHYESAVHTPDEADPSSASRTPPTPSLLSTMNSSQLLSRTRLRLISSMFSQMCDAVAACHTQQVFHRDIKPENFIVTDGFIDVDGRRERKVIVKLTDFGLSTTDVESSDMDCGSAPYMSYECRNNVAPSYRPRAADVWSLGIVLINMLYHINPWTDTKVGECNSFDVFRQQPVNFFMQRFLGMTRPVAEHLANKVFNVLDDPKDDSERISAADFGLWARDLPDLLGNHTPGHQRAGSTASSTHGHRISSSFPISYRPSSRQASGTASTIRTPAIPSRSLSRHGSFGPSFETAYEKPETSELSTVIDQEAEEQEEEREFREAQAKDMDGGESINTESRSASTTKRRKRGARKGKGGSQPPSSPKDETLENLATASQTLAREISRASRASSARSIGTTSSTRSRGRPFEPAAMYAVPVALLSRNNSSVPPLPKLQQPVPKPPAPKLAPAPPAPASDATTSPSITKKPSKWKLSFGKSSASALGRVSPVEEASPDTPVPPILMSATASNVTSVLLGLEAAPPPAPTPAVADEWAPRGRRARLPVPPSGFDPAARRDRETYNSSRSPHPGSDQWDSEQRGTSPNSSLRSHRPMASSASSMVSGNWRSSTSTTSSATTSTSAFTRYSNASVRSVSTTATSVSAASWRTNGSKPQPGGQPPLTQANPNIPKNVKILNGIPWELDQLPRGQYPNPVGDIFGSPPVRQPRTRKPKDLQLGTIAERPPPSQKSPDLQRREAAMSSSDLSSPESPREEDGDGPKKVPKAQINALAKMLSALRR